MPVLVIVPGLVTDLETEPLADKILVVGLETGVNAAEPTPTQYETPISTTQVLPTAGFQLSNCACVIPKSWVIAQQESPTTTSYHWLQLLTVPVSEEEYMLTLRQLD